MLIYTDSSRACRFHVKDRALFDELKKSYPVISEEEMILNAPPSQELLARGQEFFAKRNAGRRLRGAVDESRRLRQSDELDALENKNRESDATVTSLDDLAAALTGGQ